MALYVQSPEKVEKFLDAIERLCRIHGLSIGHEDGHGAFVIEKYNDHNLQWLRQAHSDIV
jgi:hypothetical protein